MEENNVLSHIAIILDGNRRWAKMHNLDVNQGHKEGAKVLKRIVNHAYKIGIKYLTVYAFSTENWKRNKIEVNGIMNLLYEFTKEEIKEKNNNDICIKIYGDKSILNKKIIKNLSIIEENTKNRTKLTFGICLNYGGRKEIVEAIKKVAIQVKDNNLNIEDINEDIVNSYLYTAGIPDPDMIIRTGNEQRISNFLPWQGTYSELYFPKDILWPDFNEEQLDNAILEYNNRHRRFGN